MTETPAQPARILARPGRPSIAYRATTPAPAPAGGTTAPTVVFLHGLRSDMSGSKALALEAHCRARGVGFLRFDTAGHGDSEGRFEDATIETWRDDALDVLDAITAGPLVLVGSSLGGWLMLLAALARPDRVAGLLGIAPAPDFTEDLMWWEFTPEQREELETTGRVALAGPDTPDGTVVTRAMVEAGRRCSVLGGPIAVRCPVRIIHGQRDESVPWERSLRLADSLRADDVVVTLVKDGGHRLSRPADLARICGLLDDLLTRVS